MVRVLTCCKSTILNQKDGVLPFKYTPSLPAFRNYMRLFSDSLKRLKYQKGVSLQTNMSFLNWWEILAIWIRVNMKYSSQSMVVSKLWLISVKLRLFTSDALQKSALIVQKSVKGLKRVKFLLHIYGWSTKSMKNGLRAIQARRC